MPYREPGTVTVFAIRGEDGTYSDLAGSFVIERTAAGWVWRDQTSGERGTEGTLTGARQAIGAARILAGVA